MSEKVRFESMLLLAVREEYMDRIDSIPSDEEIDKIYTASQAHTKKMDSMLRRENRNEKLIKFSKSASRVAVVFLLAISLSFSTLLTADAVRESVVTTVLEWKDEFTRIFMKSDIEADVLPEISFNYIPEGFEIVEDESFHIASRQIIMYKNSKGDFIRIIISINSKHNIDNADNEHSAYYKIKIDNNPGVWISTNDENGLLISNAGVHFNISGRLSIEEIVHIYKNAEIL